MKKGDILITKVGLEKAVEIFKNKVMNDFLEDEIPPLFVFERCIKDGTFECYMYEHDGEESGYIVTRKRDDLVFLLVLAIDEKMRGKGLGNAMVEEFKDSVKDRKIILLEAENPEATEDEKEKLIRKKRISFYEKLGFKVTENLKYLLVDIDYKILYYFLDNSGKTLETKAAMEYMEKIYEGVLRDRTKLVMEEISN